MFIDLYSFGCPNVVYGSDPSIGIDGSEFMGTSREDSWLRTVSRSLDLFSRKILSAVRLSQTAFRCMLHPTRY